MAKNPNVLGPNSTFSFNGTDLSVYVRTISIEDATDEVEVTGFNESYKEYAEGLKDATITATLVQDYGAGAVDTTIGAAYYANTAGTIKVNPDKSGTVVYTMVGKIYSYNPVNGGPGDLNTIDVTIRNAGTAGLTRGTA